MFERLQKPFLTVETGEAYQPIRLSYELRQKNQLTNALNALKCCEKGPEPDSWTWLWREECDNLHFESVSSFRKNIEHPARLATLSIRQSKLYIHLSSFKRACLATSFFHKLIQPSVACVKNADFINKVFGLDERLPHGFTELLKEEELERVVQQRIQEYQLIQEDCERASTAEEAFSLLSEYTKTEAKKRLPYAERYVFEEQVSTSDPDVLFLAFYIFFLAR